MPQYQIVKCNYSDPAHCDAVVDLLNVYIADPMGGGDQINGHKKDELITGLRNHPAGFALLALDGERYVGLATCFIGFSTFKQKKLINIHDIVVRPSHRGKGVGRSLMLEVENIAQKMDCAKVTLEVREDNIAAQELYKSLGFQDSVPPMLFWSRHL